MVADMHSLGRFAGGPIDLDLATLDRLLGERARFEEARDPEPHIKADCVAFLLRIHSTKIMQMSAGTEYPPSRE